MNGTGKSNPLVPVSPGELIDKITILEIKNRKIKIPSKLKVVRYELKLLKEILKVQFTFNKVIKKSVLAEKKKLTAVNIKLWNIENKIRAKESNSEFDSEFVTLARNVYKTNDKRSNIKNKINQLFGSGIKEIKQYTGYKNNK